MRITYTAHQYKPELIFFGIEPQTNIIFKFSDLSYNLGDDPTFDPFQPAAEIVAFIRKQIASLIPNDIQRKHKIDDMLESFFYDKLPLFDYIEAFYYRMHVNDIFHSSLKYNMHVIDLHQLPIGVVI